MYKEKRNGTIDCVRYVSAILVVALHVTAFADIHPMVSYLFAQALPRIATPYFLAVAGYFHVCRIKDGKANLTGYISRLIGIYALWSAIYVAIRLLQGEHIQILQYFVSFLFQGSEYHFWFFPALLLSASLTTLVFCMRGERMLIPLGLTLYVFACLNHSHYVIGLKIPGLSFLIQTEMWKWVDTMLCYGFPFFTCGYIVFILREKNMLGCGKICVSGVLLGLCGYLVEVFFLKIGGLSRTITATPMLYVFLILLMLYVMNDPWSPTEQIAGCCRLLANYTYYSHVAFIMIFSSMSNEMGMAQISQTHMFLTVVAATLMSGLALMRSRSRILRLLLG